MQKIMIILFLCFNISVVAQKQRGNASFYDLKFEGRPTASGEVFTQNGNTAAHRTLPFNSMVKITNLKNGNSAIVRINDRGPFIRGRIIDVTTKTAKELGFFEDGIAEVEIELLGEASLSNPVTSNQEDLNNQTTEAEIKKENTTTNVRESLTNVNNTSKNINETKEVKENSTSAVSSAPTKIAPVTPTPSKDIKSTSEMVEVFNMEVKSVSKSFFGVQIASFTDATYLMRFASEIKTSYKEDVIVLSKQQNDRKLFTLVLGQFENRLGAENFAKKVKATYPDAFIVEVNQ